MFYGNQQRLVGTTIRTLKVRATEPEQERVQREIALADWPESDRDQIVFIRKIAASSGATDIASALRSEAERQIRERPADNVHIFENNEAMLAALLNDTARGKLTSTWYWRRWYGLADQATSRALLSLSIDNSEAFCGAIIRLLETDKVLPVLNALSEQDAQQLIAELTCTMGYSRHLDLQRIVAQEHKNGRNQYGADTEAASLNPYNDSQSKHDHQAITAQQELPESLIKAVSRIPDWAELLSNRRLPDSHRILIAFILCRSLAPVALQQNAESTIAAILIKCSQRNATDQRQNNTRYKKNSEYRTRFLGSAPDQMSSEAAEPAFENASHRRINPDRIAPDPTSDQYSSDHSHISHSHVDYDISPKSEYHSDATSPKQNDSTARVSVMDKSDVRKTYNDQYPEPAVDLLSSDLTAEHITPDVQFNTRFGGIFYLLNFLNREPARKLMGEYCTSIPTGWHWLLGLIDVIPGAEKIRRDPVYVFLCDQAGLTADRLNFRLPMHCHEKLEKLALNFYGSELWHYTLINLQATVTATPDRIRVSANLKDVRIDLRLAALDVDPGWLPWLGKIVRFCFESDYFPQRYAQDCTSRYSQAPDKIAPEIPRRDEQ